MWLICLAHEHFLTQTGKKSASTYTFYGAVGPGDRGPRKKINSSKETKNPKVTTWW